MRKYHKVKSDGSKESAVDTGALSLVNRKNMQKLHTYAAIHGCNLETRLAIRKELNTALAKLGDSSHGKRVSE